MFGVFVFGIYLIVDTQMIVGGKHVELSVDEYVLAAMLLYVDIVQIFLYILRLLGNRDWFIVCYLIPYSKIVVWRVF